MNEYQIEQMNQLNQRREAMVEHVVEEITSHIAEHLRETIEWSLTGVADEIDGDKYTALVSDAFTRVVNELKKY